MEAKNIELLFDNIRSPYDIAHITMVAQAIGDCVIYTAGQNSIRFNHPKVINKVKSWNMEGPVEEVHYESFEAAIADLRRKNKYLVGTSGEADEIFYEMDIPPTKDNIVVVFGTESSGLSRKKQEMLDTVVKLPMDKAKVDFLTLPVAVSAIAYELHRQRIKQEV